MNRVGEVANSPVACVMHADQRWGETLGCRKLCPHQSIGLPVDSEITSSTAYPMRFFSTCNIYRLYVVHIIRLIFNG